jgi:hypothetical protein
MAISVYPIASTSTGPDAYAVTVPNSTQKYKLTQAFAPGVYSIVTSPTSSQATVNFFNATSITPNSVTVSGTVSYNLGTAANGVYVSIDTGTNVVVSITLVANSLTGTTLSGTLDTISATGNYNTTGQLYVLALGGGGGAGGGDGNAGGGGGGAGFQTSGIIYANAATAVTIGAGGNGGAGNANGNAGGTTTFGANITAVGANGGSSAFGGGSGGNGSASGGNSNYNASNTGGASAVIASAVTTGTTGGGGGNSTNAGGKAGGGSGIGTGGAGSASNPGAAGTGFASGGGAGGQSSTGGAGRPGVVYVLRGF